MVIVKAVLSRTALLKAKPLFAALKSTFLGIIPPLAGFSGGVASTWLL
jgi:hypothetical protein